MNLVFSLSSLLVMPFWFLMIFLPHWKHTKTIIGSPYIIVPAALLYAALVIPNIGSTFAQLANPNLEGISKLLGSSSGATAGWVHFLAFDLFVGRYVYLEGQKRNLNVFLMGLVLFSILMYGPLGMLIFLAISAFSAKNQATKTSDSVQG
jgi:Domain of unknown function (DUF4281)